MHLRLYTTLGCHLCDALESWLKRLASQPMTLEHIEISDDDALMCRYGVRIPVLADDDGNELERGFEPARLASWLDERGCLNRAAWRQLDQKSAERAKGSDKSDNGFVRGGRRYLG